jgi:predicted TPR repeat methyltransferase
LSNRKEIHDRVLNASNKEELRDVYSEWADKYDHDLLIEMGYVAPVVAGKLLLEYLDDKEALVMDAGCGTGLVGEFLHQEGYLNIEGLDYSEQMLEKARGKGFYKKLSQGDLLGRLDITENTFDSIISVGTFTCGHVGPAALNELVRITRPGGFICITVRDQAWEEDNYHAEMSQIEKNGLWKLLEERTEDYIQDDSSSCKVCLYQITA